VSVLLGFDFHTVNEFRGTEAEKRKASTCRERLSYTGRRDETARPAQKNTPQAGMNSTAQDRDGQNDTGTTRARIRLRLFQVKTLREKSARRLQGERMLRGLPRERRYGRLKKKR